MVSNKLIHSIYTHSPHLISIQKEFPQCLSPKFGIGPTKRVVVVLMAHINIKPTNKKGMTSIKHQYCLL